MKKVYEEEGGKLCGKGAKKGGAVKDGKVLPRRRKGRAVDLRGGEHQGRSSTCSVQAREKSPWVTASLLAEKKTQYLLGRERRERRLISSGKDLRREKEALTGRSSLDVGQGDLDDEHLRRKGGIGLSLLMEKTEEQES